MAGWTSSTRNSVYTLEQYKRVTDNHSTPRLFTLHSPTDAARQAPPLNTLSLGLNIRRSPYLLDDVLLKTRLSSEDVAFNGTLTTPASPSQMCMVGNPISRFSPISM